jgi:hypothetical protein
VGSDAAYLLACGAGLAVLPLGLYAWHERRGRAAWPAPPADGAPAFEGYRRVRRPRPGAPKAPAFVRLTALSCFAFGQMFLPGVVAGALGLVFGGAGVLLLPGLWVAYAELAVGRALLLRAPAAAEHARALAGVSGSLNLVLLPLFATVALSPSSLEFATFWAALALAYVLASLAQAALLFWAARRLGPAR